MSRNPASSAGWPPESGKEFICGEEFGDIVLAWCDQLGRRYPHMDFSDAASQVFSWFDRKLASNGRFINRSRFRTKAAFIAYVRQCVWNAARVTQRERQRHNQIAALPADAPIAAEEIPPDGLVELKEAVETLPEPHRSILQRILFEEDDVATVAAELNLPPSDVARLYQEAIDRMGGRFE